MPVKFVVDAGTGTTTVGLGVAAMSLGLGFVHKIYQYTLCLYVSRVPKLLAS